VGYDGFLLDESKNGYLVMEYVDGPSLKQVLTDRPLSIAEIYLLRDRLASGLTVVHDKGTFHRDISPDNIILPGGHVENAKLIDFGIAKRSDPTVRTIIGDVFAGKRGYAAPEQFGLSGGQVGPYSDIYSLGLVLAAAATGRSLDMGSSNETAIQARQRVPDLSQVPAELQPQLTAMLQPNPADRPQTVAELIRRWPRPLTRLEELKKWLEEYKATLIVIGIVVIGVMGGIFFIINSDADICKLNSKQLVERLNNSTPTQREQLIARIAGCPPEQLIKKVIPLPKEWSEAVMAKIAELPPEQIASYAQKFYDNGSLDNAFVLWKWAAGKGHGPSALML
jgi:serine/threonine-protein kinase